MNPLRHILNGLIDQPSSSGRRLLRSVFYGAGGFTLVEILVVLLIISVMSVGVTLTMPNRDSSMQEQIIRRWHAQAQWAANQSLWTGKPRVWEVTENGARVLLRYGDTWIQDEAPEARRLSLPSEMHLRKTVLDGELKQSEMKVFFRSSNVPAFSLQIESLDSVWEISGDPGGSIIWKKSRQENH